MVGVVEGVRGDVPGLVPAEAVLVDEQAHQFGDADGGVGVVELDGPLLVELVECVDRRSGECGSCPAASRRRRNTAVEAEFLALDIFVVGVEDFGDVFGEDLCVDRAVIVAAVEARRSRRTRWPRTSRGGGC